MTRERGYIIATAALVLTAAIVFLCVLMPSTGSHSYTRFENVGASHTTSRTGKGPAVESAQKPSTQDTGEPIANPVPATEDTGTGPADGPVDNGAAVPAGNPPTPDAGGPADDAKPEVPRKLETGTIIIAISSVGEGTFPGRPALRAKCESATRWNSYWVNYEPDKTGRFIIKSRPGIFTVEVSRPGYKMETVKDVAIVAGAETAIAVVLELLTAEDAADISIITGVVTDSYSGAPIKGAVIQCWRFDKTGDFCGCTRDVLSGEMGRYRLDTDHEGMVSILVHAETAEDFAYNYDGERFKLEKGSRHVFDASLERLTCRVSGAVRDSATGEIIEDAHQELVEGTRAQFRFRRDDPPGRFSYTLKHGECMLRFRAVGYATKEIKLFLAYGEKRELEVLLNPAETVLSLTVVDRDTGKPVEGVTVKLRDNPDATTGPDGKFRAVVPSWSVRLELEKDGYLDGDLWLDSLPEGSVTERVLKLAPLSCSISGTVTDAELGLPIAGVDVEFGSSVRAMAEFDWSLIGMPAGSRWAGNRETSTDADGRYTLAVEAGEGRLCFALFGHRDEELMIPKLSPGETRTVNISLKKYDGSLYIRVIDANSGESIEFSNREVKVEESVALQAGVQKRRYWLYSPHRDRKSIIGDVNLIFGSYTISIDIKGYYTETREIKFEKEMLIIDLVLTSFGEATAEITGVVKSPDDRWNMARIRVRAYFAGKEIADVDTDEEGRFRFDVPPGEVTIKCRGFAGRGTPDFEAEVKYLVEEDESREVEIILDEVRRAGE